MNDFERVQIVFFMINCLILIVSVYFIAKGPINAVRVGRILNNEEEKDNAKRELFLLLFSLRGNPIHYDFVRGLNEIDVVFEDVPEVLAAWHKHYDSLHIEGLQNREDNWQLQRIELLSAMAVHLGYSRIRQTDMIRSYYPVGHNAQIQDDLDLRQDLIAYLKTNVEMNQRLIERMDNPSDQDQ